MNEKQQEIVSKGDEISLKDAILNLKKFWLYLVSKWLTIAAAAIIGGLLGLGYSYLKKTIYIASVNFVLEDSAGGGLGQYAGLASIVGIDLGGAGNNNGIFSGDNILELYKSRLMIQGALLSKVPGSKNELFVDRYITFNKLRPALLKKVLPEDLNFNLKKGVPFSRKQDSVLSTIVTDIRDNYLTVSKPDKKLAIIEVQLKAKDEVFAKEYATQIVSNVNQFFIVTKTKKSTQNLLILQHQSDSIKTALYGALGGAAAATDNNPNANPLLQVLKVPSQKRLIEAEANKAIFAELTKNLEIAKVSLRNETPLIQIIDSPIYPLKTEKVGKIKGAVAGAFILSFLCAMVITVKLILKRIFE